MNIINQEHIGGDTLLETVSTMIISLSGGWAYNPSQERAAVREMSVQAITRELESIAKGEVAGFSREERKAAFGLLNELGRMEGYEKLNVQENWHQELQEPKHLRSQIQPQREQAVQRSRAQEVERDRGRGMVR